MTRTGESSTGEGRAGEKPRHGDVRWGGQPLGKARTEVGNLGHGVVGAAEEDILELEVAVRDALAMQVVQGFCEWGEQGQDLFHRKTARANPSREFLALDVLQDGP